MVAAVLYTDDMEPVTVFDMPVELAGRRWVDFAIWDASVLPGFIGPDEPIRCEPIKTVTVRAEKFVRNGVYHTFWFVDERDLENALLMRADFLPGQQRTLREKVDGAFMAGVLTVLR